MENSIKGEVERLTTQKEDLLEYLKGHKGGITQIEALYELGIMRLASRVCDLKADGYLIKKEWQVVRARNGRKASIKRYYLFEEGDDNAREC